MSAELKQNAATGAPASCWKPYPAYRDSGVEWLGKVPEHWEVKRLKWISYINPVKSNSKFDKNSEDLVTFLPMEKVSEDGKIDIEIKKPIKDLWNGFTYFEENDIIVAKITPCFENGKGALIKNLGSKVGFGSTEFHVLRPKENIIKELLYYLTKSDIFMKLGEASMTGAAGQKRVTNSFLEDFFICYPKDIGKQKSISLFLDDRTRKIDSLIEKKQKMIELLKEERAAVINQAVTKGLNPDAPMKDSGIEWLGEVPEHWKVKKLKYVAEVVLGKMLTSDDKGGYFYKPYLRAQNIGWQKVNADDIKQMWFSEKELEQYRVKLNDLLVSEGGEVGRTAIWKNIIEECYIQNSVHKVTMLDGNNPHYFLYLFFLYGQMGYFDSIVSRVSIAHLTREKLKEVFCLIPSIGEQKHIVKLIELESAKIDSAVSIIEKELLLLQEYRTALISEIVTGKIDVREAT